MKITENMITIDWLYDTGELAIVIMPKQVNLRDMEKEDFYKLSPKELMARHEFEQVRKALVKFLKKKEFKMS